MKLSVTDKQFLLEPEPNTESWGDLVLHPGAHPNSAFSYNLKKIWLKTPSEHAID